MNISTNLRSRPAPASLRRERTRAPPLGPQPARPHRTPALAAAPRGLQADARSGMGEGLAPRSEEPMNPPVRSWAAPSIIAVVWGGTRSWSMRYGAGDAGQEVAAGWRYMRWAPANRGGQRRCCRSGARARGEEEEQRKGRLEVVLAGDGGTQA